MKKLVKLCLHSSYKVQNSFQFDEIFSQKAENCEFYFRKKLWKNSWNFVYIQATQCRTPFNLTRFFFTTKLKIRILISKKYRWKSRETLFTFKLHSAELLSFWRDFKNSNFGLCDMRHLAAILGSIETKLTYPNFLPNPT